MAATAQAPAPASLFGLPGYTRPTEQVENNDGLTATLSTASTTNQTGIIPFKQTDVVLGWEIAFTIAQTVTVGGGTLTTSPYFPYNYVNTLQLAMQNQFNTIQVINGIDAAFLQACRPMRQTDVTSVLYTNPFSMYSAQANLVSAGNYTSASTSVKFTLEIPGGLWFDAFYPLDDQGKQIGQPMRCFVSPQYMAGTARIVQPVLTFANIGLGSTVDTNPFNITGGAPSITGSTTINVLRRGYYQPQGPADSPPVFNWQYTRKSSPYSIAGRSTVDIPVPLNGQLLLIAVRLFDPSAASNVGAAINVGTNVTKCQLLYGSGLYRFQDTPQTMQRRFLAQHLFLPPAGFIAWDLALDDQGRVTNAFALNTMNTSGITVHLEFTGAQSSTAYAVVIVEALTYIEV